MRIRSATDNPAELFFDTNGAIRWDISCRNGSSPNLQFYPQAATPALNNVAAHTFELQQNGNVVVTGNGSSGRMGIGTTSPVSKLEVRDALNSTNFTGITVTNSEGGGSNLSRAGIAFKAYDWVQGAIWHGRNMGDGNQGALVLGTNPNTSDLTVGGVVGRMYIINNGNVGIGTASPGAKLSIAAAGADGLQLEADTGSTNNSARLFWKASSGAWAIMNNSQNFSIRSGAVVGSTSGTEKIRLTGYSATSWTSGSDETIKENIISIGNVLDKINDYRCVEYNLIDDETKDKKIGFIAQDWQEDFPQIIEQMENEKIGMKYTETIPILLKAIQELKAEIETLKTQING
jgi:hypothetical protein